jgi:hypothetical protein
LTVRLAGAAALVCLAVAALLVVPGCSSGPGTTTGSAESSRTPAGMGGPAVDINVSQAVLDAKPKPADLKTPESAVRSYLDWTSYAYRIGLSGAANHVMTSVEEVRVNSFVQYNAQKSRLISQTLDSITFGKPSVGTTNTLVPAKEKWTYSYLSIAVGNKAIGGPYTASYDTTYTVVKDEAKGVWLVDSVKAKALGPVK